MCLAHGNIMQCLRWSSTRNPLISSQALYHWATRHLDIMQKPADLKRVQNFEKIKKVNKQRLLDTPRTVRNMFARFDENPAMTLQDIKETKRYGQTHGQHENSIPTTKFAGGITTTNKVWGEYKKIVGALYFGIQWIQRRALWMRF